MKQIKLLELILRNFKGVQEFRLVANGGNLKVYGDNASGKTTLFDAFTWLLFGKDSRNRTDFEIKTLDESGKVKQHGLMHEVEGIFEVNGAKISFKRVFEEKWTKKRGSSRETFTGHTTTYYIDDIPVKMKEYNEKVNELVSEDLFKLLTNPLYFNEQMDWKKRRAILFEMAGEVSDEEVARKDEKLSDFIYRLNGRNVEDHIKVIKARQKKINDALDDIPVRIDQIQLTMPEVDGSKKAEIEKELQRIENEIESIQETIANVRNGGEISKKKADILEIDLGLRKIRNEHESGNNDEKLRLKVKIQENESNIKIWQSEISTNERIISRFKERQQKLEEELLELRKEYVQENMKQFQHEAECTCPTCGQELPAEQIEEAKQKALESFNLEKAEKLKKIATAGKRKNNELDELKKDMEKLEQKNEKLHSEIIKTRTKIELLNQEIQSIEASSIDIMDIPEYVAKLKEKKALEQGLQQLQEQNALVLLDLEEDIRELKQERMKNQSRLAEFTVAERGRKQIAELEKQEKELTAEYEALEEELFLAETFIRMKADLLEEKINGMFRYVTFKLFEQQINGGLNPTCVTLYKGIPYDKGLNNSAQINSGLDIINTLNNYYQIFVPIFVDNSESVTRLIDMDTQLIQLIVSENDKTLRVTQS